MSKNVYALYKGEELLAIGTVKEIAEVTGLKPRTLYFYATPAWRKRRKKNGNFKLLTKLDIGDEEE